MRAPLSYIPLLPVTLLFIIGIVAAHFLSAPYWIALPLTATGVFWYFDRRYTAILCLAFALGWVDMLIHHQDKLPVDFKPRIYTGLVTGIKETESSTILHIDLQFLSDSSTTRFKPIRCRAIVVVPSHEHTPRCGDEIGFRTTWSKIESHLDLPDETDPSQSYTRNGIYFSSVIRPTDILSVVPSPVFKGKLMRMRERVSQLIFRSSLSGPAKDFINTALTGDNTTFPRATREVFTKSGLAHILALSGLHVGIIAMAVSIALWPLYLLQYRKLHIILTIFLLWIYALVTGLSPSVTRAVVMATVFLSATLLQRYYSPWNALCLSAIVILLIDPLSLFAIGFQLSFSAVAGILIFMPVINTIPPRRWIIRNIIGYLTISFAAMLGTAALSAYYFHSLPLYFAVSNALVAVFLPFLLGGSILLVLIESYGVDPSWLCDTLSFIYRIIESIASTVSQLPGSAIDNLYFPAWVIIPIIICIISIALWLHSHKEIFALSSLAIASATIGIFVLQPDTTESQTLYIGRHTYRTDILVRCDNKLYLATTAPVSEWEIVRDDATFRYRNFMNRRHIDSICPMPIQFYNTNISRNGGLFSIGNRILYLMHSDSLLTPLPLRPDFILIARGFTGHIDDILKNIECDTVLLGCDLHPWRHERYIRECNALGKPYVSLRDRPFNL